MKRNMLVAFLVIAVLCAVSVPAFAGVGEIIDKVKSAVNLQLISLVLTIGLGKIAFDTTRIKRAMRETGEFLSVLGDAFEDDRITKDELADILREGRDIIDVARKTPVQYQV